MKYKISYYKIPIDNDDLIIGDWSDVGFNLDWHRGRLIIASLFHSRRFKKHNKQAWNNPYLHTAIKTN